MKLIEFVALEEKRQIESTYQGIFLARRIKSGNEIFLYSLNDFYIELYFSIGLQRIVKVRAFGTINLIEPYLDQIVRRSGIRLSKTHSYICTSYGKIIHRRFFQRYEGDQVGRVGQRTWNGQYRNHRYGQK